MNNPGVLIVFSGPSGAGKDTVLKELLALNKNLCLSVSATTRSPREGEQDGKDYFFLSRERFEEMIRADQMLEHAVYCDNYYGTPRGPVDEALAAGKDVILEIEVNGASQIIRKCPGCVSIFLMPPSIAVLEHRLRKRQTEDEQTIQKRLAKAREEMSHASSYGHVVVNDALEKAVADIDAILRAEKQKRSDEDQK